jgi:hypothetical protein
MVVKVLYKTMHHFFPSFRNWVEAIEDPRQEGKVIYPMTHIVYVAALMFLLKVESRRQIKYLFSTEQFLRHLNLLTRCNVDRVAHPDTVGDLSKRVDPEDISWVRSQMIRALIRKKCLVNHRLLGQYYLVSVDGTGHLVFKERHCPHCLTERKNRKVIYYYHPVLEAKLVTGNGMALSMETEFIENPGAGESRQDCELTAFYRFRKRLKKYFPQLRICLLLDALYAGLPVFDICREYGWKYICVFKEGSMPETYREYMSLKSLQKENVGVVRDGEVVQRYNWVTDIDYQGHLLNVLECNENKPGKGGRRSNTRFVWLTNLKVDKYNYRQIGNEGGRLRWKIENEGFNMQKNGGYNLKHAYSRNEIACKNFYLLLQIAHMINQLIEKGSPLKNQVKKAFGSIRNISRKLLEELRTTFPDPEALHAELAVPFQIRFNDSS